MGPSAVNCKCLHPIETLVYVYENIILSGTVTQNITVKVLSHVLSYQLIGTFEIGR